MPELLMVLLGALILSVLVVLFRFLKRKEIELEQAFQERFAGEQIICMDKHTVLVAQESRGYSQIKGGGYLVLTSRELFFKLQLMDKEIRIPVASLVRVGETHRMKGKGTLRAMLKINFTTADGKKDALALLVKDLPTWKSKLARIIEKNHTND